MTAFSKITAAQSRVGLAASEPTVPEWTISPSPFDWQVMIFGGTHDGVPLPPLEFQFFKRHYTLAGVIERADELAGWNHRTRFLVRDTHGRVVADEAVCWPVERRAA